MNKQLAELVEGAFDYYPFRWNSAISVNGYAVGPTFLAYCPGFEAKERRAVYEESEGSANYRSQVSRSLIEYAPEPDPAMYVSKDAHKRHRTKENCKARALMLGEYEMDIELAYPLYKLMRFFKPDRFGLRDGILYAWDGERVVFIGATRPRILNCTEDEYAA